MTGPAAQIAYAVLANWAVEKDPHDEVLAAMREIGRRIRHAVGG